MTDDEWNITCDSAEQLHPELKEFLERSNQSPSSYPQEKYNKSFVGTASQPHNFRVMFTQRVSNPSHVLKNSN